MTKKQKTVMFSSTWLMTRSNVHAVVVPCPFVLPPHATEAKESAVTMVERWRGVPTRAYDLGPLVTLLQPPPCDICKGVCTVECDHCGGGGWIERQCSECMDTHDCRCKQCHEGERDCECVRDKPIRVLGSLFDRNLLADLVERMTIAKETPSIGAGLLDGPDGATTLVLRHGETVGIVMPLRATGHEGAPSWP